MQRRFYGKSLWLTQNSTERKCVHICVCGHFHYGFSQFDWLYADHLGLLLPKWLWWAFYWSQGRSDDGLKMDPLMQTDPQMRPRCTRRALFKMLRGSILMQTHLSTEKRPGMRHHKSSAAAICSQHSVQSCRIHFSIKEEVVSPILTHMWVHLKLKHLTHLLTHCAAIV